MSKSKTRAYLVIPKEAGKGKRLIEAANDGQVHRHLSNEMYGVHAATTKDYMDALKEGANLESVIKASGGSAPGKDEEESE